MGGGDGAWREVETVGASQNDAIIDTVIVEGGGGAGSCGVNGASS